MYLYLFYNNGFATNLVLEILVVFQNLKTKEFVSGFLILNETCPIFDKNILRRFEV
jgi:hypothetical protein